MPDDDLDNLIKKLRSLSTTKRRLVSHLVDRLNVDIDSALSTPSDPFDHAFVSRFGEILQTHHALSNQPFTKDKFEWAMVEAFKGMGRRAEHGPPGLAGYDIEIDGHKWSLKTQADRSIKPDSLHISKFMEMGKGEWVDEKSLVGLRDRFLAHLNGYERIFSLRHFDQVGLLGSDYHEYELVEIPKSLLGEAANGCITMQHKSKQTPKPGYCRITDDQGTLRFELYFDGGTERKLQIKNLQKSLCTVIATWKFPK